MKKISRFSDTNRSDTNRRDTNVLPFAEGEHQGNNNRSDRIQEEEEDDDDESKCSQENCVTQEQCEKAKRLVKSLLPSLPCEMSLVNAEWSTICLLSGTFGDLIKPRTESNDDAYCKSQLRIGKKQYGWRKKLFLQEQSLTALFFVICNYADNLIYDDSFESQVKELEDENESKIEITGRVEYFKYKCEEVKLHDEPQPKLKNIMKAFYKKFVQCWCDRFPLRIVLSKTLYRRDSVQLKFWSSEEVDVIDIGRREGEAIQPKLQIHLIHNNFGEYHFPIKYSCEFLRVGSWDCFIDLVTLLLDVADIDTHKLHVNLQIAENQTDSNPIVDLDNLSLVRPPPLLVPISKKRRLLR